MILVTGGNGQLAQCIRNRFIGTYHDILTPTHEEMDITDLDGMRKYFAAHTPDAVIHCAAYCSVDGAEDDVETAAEVNVQGTTNVAQVCKEFGAYLIYISTDYVFDGTKVGAYEVDDRKNPLSVYGKTKSAGEDAVLAASDQNAVLRISWLYSDSDKNFVATIMRLAKERDEITVVNDQIGSPTYAPDVANLLFEMVGKRVSGIFHGTNEGYCTWADFAERIVRMSGSDTKVTRTSSEKYGARAIRPKNSVLSKSSLDKAGLKRLPTWENALERTMAKRTGVKRVFVTGASGYIGRHVVSALCDKGAQVLIPNRHADEIDLRAQRIDVDIFSGSPSIYYDLGCPDAVVHLAWRDGFVHNSDAHLGELSKHYTLIKNLMQGGLKQIAVMGTMHEVGYFEGAIDENTPCNPTSMYGIAKDALRRSTLQLGKEYGATVQWLRAYYICGDDKRNNSIFAKIIHAEEEGQELFPFTSGKNMYDFIQVEDLAQQIAACILQTEVDGIINCCTGVPMTLADKVEGFIKEQGFKIRLNYGAYPDRTYDSPGVWGNAEKIQKIMHIR